MLETAVVVVTVPVVVAVVVVVDVVAFTAAGPKSNEVIAVPNALGAAPDER